MADPVTPAVSPPPPDPRVLNTLTTAVAVAARFVAVIGDAATVSERATAVGTPLFVAAAAAGLPGTLAYLSAADVAAFFAAFNQLEAALQQPVLGPDGKTVLSPRLMDAVLRAVQ